MSLGLLDDDSEWYDALNEASTLALGIQLQNMFCSILMFSEIADLVKFWGANWVQLEDDLLYATQLQIEA